MNVNDVDPTRKLNAEELEDLKERYPVQQSNPEDEEETTDVEEIKDYTTELDRDEDTRERG